MGMTDYACSKHSKLLTNVSNRVSDLMGRGRNMARRNSRRQGSHIDQMHGS